MRKKWKEIGGQFCVVISSFFAVFMLQGLFMCIVGGSALFIAIYSHEDDDLFVLEFLGAFVFLFGFIFEVVADMQLRNHIKNPDNRGKLIKTGLWRYTRHPNYFGEAVLWWGVWLIACSIKWGWSTFFAALFITLIIRFVSGVPFLEEKYKDREDFKQYCKETNCFFPWFVRKVKEPQVHNSDQAPDPNDRKQTDSVHDEEGGTNKVIKM